MADDTLVNTPTVPAIGAPTPTPRASIPHAIGRYTITAQLGEGGMGVVYAGHDPDLDRRVAVKILRHAGSDASRARLLREARAMAKLAHPAVVSVYEVGTAQNIDYVAMELIDGGSLADWLDDARRAHAAILGAFDTAGRGLAAAHAAGIVHRDFKPHNVLRSTTGRIVVTDFGLARSAGVATEAPPGSTPADSLTATGAVLGTPAYMAPEQHDGDDAGPAADQFAFCVALWEALSGARPFPGRTTHEVRVRIDAGPDRASEASVPRRLRAVLRRGMALDPAARWPSMEALLRALQRKSAWLVVAAILLLLVFGMAVGSISAMLRAHDAHDADSAAPVATAPALDGCGDPDALLAPIVHAPARARMAASPEGRHQLALVDATIASWRDARAAICTATTDPVRARCLHDVITDLRQDMLAVDQLTDTELLDANVNAGIAEPASCRVEPEPPVREVYDDATAVRFVVAELGDHARRASLVEPPASVPCLRTEYLMLTTDFAAVPEAEREAAVRKIDAAADLCHDDRIEAALTFIDLNVNPLAIAQDTRLIARMDSAYTRSGQSRLVGVFREYMLAAREQLFTHPEASLEHYQRGFELALAVGSSELVEIAGVAIALALRERGHPGDFERAEAITLEALASVGPKHRSELQRELFRVRFAQGRLDAALAIAREIRDPVVAAAPGTRAVRGSVVDDAGHPVAGARVVAKDLLVYDGGYLDPIANTATTTTTGADGSFSLAGIPPTAWIAAQLGARYTIPAALPPESSSATLALRPTATLHGTVRVTGAAGSSVQMIMFSEATQLHAAYAVALAADGTWSLAGVPAGPGTLMESAVAATERHTHPVTAVVGDNPPISTAIDLTGYRLNVIVRSQIDIALGRGAVWVVHGPMPSRPPRIVADVAAITEAVDKGAIPPSPSGEGATLQAALHRGDVLARFLWVESGPAMVCAVAATGDIGDADARARFEAALPKLPVTCVAATLDRDDQVVTIEVPPPKRAD